MISEISGKVAVNASSAMALEVSASPKPGNVHRTRNFPGTTFEHFLLSSISALPVFEETAEFHENGMISEEIISKSAYCPFVGKLIKKAVDASVSAQSGGNTHFGTFILMIPLVAAASAVESTVEITDETAVEIADETTVEIADEIADETTDETADETAESANFSKFGKILKIAEIASEICKNTTAEDSFYFYSAFSVSGAVVQDDPEGEFDLSDPKSAENARLSGRSLFSLMKDAEERDIVAAEWTQGFEKSVRFSRLLAFHYYCLKTCENSDNPDSENSDNPDHSKNPEHSDSPPNSGKSCINTAILLTFVEFLANVPDTFIITKQGKESALEVCEKANRLLFESGIWSEMNKCSESGVWSESDIYSEICSESSSFYGYDHRAENIRVFYEKLEELDLQMAKKKQNPGSIADICAAGIFLFLEGGEKI